jgi:excisionase family DNA binding protein
MRNPTRRNRNRIATDLWFIRNDPPMGERALEHVSIAAIPRLIGDLERLQVLLAARLMRETVQTAPATRSNDALEDLHHLTPAQVAELLNLTEPYVHELCRTRRIQATKSGKYWMIRGRIASVAGVSEA